MKCSFWGCVMNSSANAGFHSFTSCRHRSVPSLHLLWSMHWSRRPFWLLQKTCGMFIVRTRRRICLRKWHIRTVVIVEDKHSLSHVYWLVVLIIDGISLIIYGSQVFIGTTCNLATESSPRLYVIRGAFVLLHPVSR